LDGERTENAAFYDFLTDCGIYKGLLSLIASSITSCFIECLTDLYYEFLCSPIYEGAKFFLSGEPYAPIAAA
jgi:hypothetical protein